MCLLGCIDIMYVCPYLDLEVLDPHSLVLPTLGRIEVVIPTILWLASAGFIIHCLHSSITSQLCFNPTSYLTCGMEDLSLLKKFCHQLRAKTQYKQGGLSNKGSSGERSSMPQVK